VIFLLEIQHVYMIPLWNCVYFIDNKSALTLPLSPVMQSY